MSFRITVLWAYTTIDEGDEEGVIAEWSPHGWVPMIGADEARIRSLEKVAQATANHTGKTIKLSKFSVREDIKDILPTKKD